ncbi:MAG TPA: hypothetical protein VEY51_07570, partial [Chondromyces sp.]|nr:hypothetical protein [Chondromyces sp.]
MFQEQFLNIGSINIQSKLNASEELIIEYIQKYNINILCIQDCGIARISEYTLKQNNLGIFYNSPPISDPAAYLAIIYDKNKVQLNRDIFTHYRLLAVNVTFPFRFNLINCYNKLRMPELESSISKMYGKSKTIITGDFNNTVSIQLDRYCAAKGGSYQHYTGKTIKGLINSGYIDSFRYLNPTLKKYSRFGINNNNSVTMSRLDYCLISKDFKNKLYMADIIENDIFDSDHRLVITTLLTDIKSNIKPPTLKEKKIVINWGNQEKIKELPEALNKAFNEINLPSLDNNNNLDTWASSIAQTIDNTAKKVLGIKKLDQNALNYAAQDKRIGLFKRGKKKLFIIQTICQRLQQNLTCTKTLDSLTTKYNKFANLYNLPYLTIDS